MINITRFIFTFAFAFLRALGPGGTKALAAENAALKQQLITMSRKSKQSPRLKTSDRFIYGFLVALTNPKRLAKVAVIEKFS